MNNVFDTKEVDFNDFPYLKDLYQELYQFETIEVQEDNENNSSVLHSYRGFKVIGRRNVILNETICSTLEVVFGNYKVNHSKWTERGQVYLTSLTRQHETDSNLHSNFCKGDQYNCCTTFMNEEHAKHIINGNTLYVGVPRFKEGIIEDNNGRECNGRLEDRPYFIFFYDQDLMERYNDCENGLRDCVTDAEEEELEQAYESIRYSRDQLVKEATKEYHATGGFSQQLTRSEVAKVLGDYSDEDDYDDEIHEFFDEYGYYPY